MLEQQLRMQGSSPARAVPTQAALPRVRHSFESSPAHGQRDVESPTTQQADALPHAPLQTKSPAAFPLRGRASARPKRAAVSPGGSQRRSSLEPPGQTQQSTASIRGSWFIGGADSSSEIRELREFMTLEKHLQAGASPQSAAQAARPHTHPSPVAVPAPDPPPAQPVVWDDVALFDDDEAWDDQQQHKSAKIDLEASLDGGEVGETAYSPERPAEDDYSDDNSDEQPELPARSEMHDIPMSEVRKRTKLVRRAAGRVRRPKKHSGTAVARPATASSITSRYFNTREESPKRPKSSPKRPKSSHERRKSSPAPQPAATQSRVTEQVSTLEREVAQFQADAAELRRIRREQEQELAMLRQDNAAMRKRLEQRAAEFEEHRRETEKALKRERLAVERERARVQQLPDRQERSQLADLRDELAQVKEELRAKEERHRLSVDRLKHAKQVLHDKVVQLEAQLQEEQRQRHEEQAEHEQEVRKLRAKLQRLKKEEASDQEPKQPTLRGDPVVAKQSRRQRAVRFSEHVDVRSVPAREVAAPEPQAVAVDDGYENAAAAAAVQAPQDDASTQSLDDEDAAVVLREIQHADGKLEQRLSDGSRQVIFPNGTQKRVFPDHRVVVDFPSGDRKETFPDAKVVYYYASADTTHTTYPSGLQVYVFGDQQQETHYADGTKEIVYADGTAKYVSANGDEQTIFPDGTVHRVVGGERSVGFLDPDDVRPARA